MDRPLMPLVPQPRKVQPRRGELPIRALKRIAFVDLFDPHTFRAACYLRDELAERLACTLPVEQAGRAARTGQVLVGLLSAPTVRKAMGAAASAAEAQGAEGYIVEVKPSGAVIAGADGAGLFHGVQTFLQLAARRDAAWSVPAVHVADRPMHPFRGVHLYLPPRQEIPHLVRLMGYLASIKVNTVILELGGALQFKRYPEINRAFQEFCQIGRDNAFGQNPGLSLYHPLHGCYGNSTHVEQGGHSWITQDDMREILAAAKRHNLKVIPEVQSLSHSYWLCMAHPEVAERQGELFPAAYCPSNQRTYEILLDCVDEVIEVMQPEWVMIGHDEWYHYAICPRCRHRTGADILVDDVNRLHAHLKRRGVKCMMWPDRLMDPREAKVKTHPDPLMGRVPYGTAERVFVDHAGGKYVRKNTEGSIDRVGDDILMADWHYRHSPDTEQFFARHGKTMIYGNFSPRYFDQHPRRLAAHNVRGGEYSTWYENSLMAMASQAWPANVLPFAEMVWMERWKAGQLAERQNLYDAFWRHHRDRLLDSTRRLPSRAPTGKLRSAAMDLSRADRQGAAATAEPPAPLTLEGVNLPVPIKPARGPLVLPGATDARIVLPVGRQIRGIAFLLRWLPGSKALDGRPIYGWPYYSDYYIAREVGRARAILNMVPTSPYRREMEGVFNIVLGAHVGLKGQPAGLADRIALSGQEPVYLYEWRNHNPDFWRIERLVLEAGRNSLDGRLVIYGASLIL